MSIQRLYIICEGQTEETFVSTTLYPHLFNRNGANVIPIVLPSKRGPNASKGGWVSYTKAKSIIRNLMAGYHSEETWFTTMLDLYAIPADFPGLADASTHDPRARVKDLEESFNRDIRTDDLWRFSAHLQLHEFEALLLADPSEFKISFPNREQQIGELINEIAGIEPELVNHGRETAPSKRIIRYVPEYERRKVSTGPIIADRIGLNSLRNKCRHFSDWLQHIEEKLDND